MEQTEARTHAIRALIALRRRILSGELSGGTRLYEVPLAEDLQISRTPVREAMSRLVEEGLLERARSGGFVVRSFGVVDVIGSFAAGDAVEVREAITAVHVAGAPSGGRLLGKGIANLSAAELRRVQGMQSPAAREVLPRAAEEAVHRDYFVLA